MKTFKDYIVEQLSDMGIEDHDGNYYQACEIHDRFDDFLEDVSKEELIEWGNDFYLENITPTVRGRVTVRPEPPRINTKKWVDSIIGIKNFSN